MSFIILIPCLDLCHHYFWGFPSASFWRDFLQNLKIQKRIFIFILFEVTSISLFLSSWGIYLLNFLLQNSKNRFNFYMNLFHFWNENWMGFFLTWKNIWSTKKCNNTCCIWCTKKGEEKCLKIESELSSFSLFGFFWLK